MINHLTVLKSENVDAERTAGKENKKKNDSCKYSQHGIEKFQTVASPEPHQAHKGREGSSLLPLCVGRVVRGLWQPRES